MVPLIGGAVRFIVTDVLTYVVKEISSTVYDWAKRRIISYAASKAREWVSDIYDWAVEKIFGKRADDIEKAGMIDSVVDADAVMSGQTLEEKLRLLFSSPQGRAKLGQWIATLAEESGLAKARRDWLILGQPIPRDQTLFKWANLVADEVGLTPTQVLERRLQTV